MTRRILRTELRRSAAPWIAVLIALAGAVMLYAVARGWVGRWTNLVLFQRLYLFVLWPLATGAGAWQGRRDVRARMRELLGTTPRPRWQRVLPTAGALAIAAVVGYLAMLLAGAVRAVDATYLPAGAVPIVAVGALSLVAAVWLGLAIGTRAPYRLTPPVVVVVGLLVAMVAPVMLEKATRGRDLPGTLLLSPMLTGVSSDFGTVAGRVHAGQAVWLAGLALTSLVLLGAARRTVLLAAVVPAVLGAAFALAVMPDREADVVVPDPASYALVCTADAPKVCVTKVHAAQLSRLRGPARQALAVLGRRLPDAPTTVVEAHVSWVEKRRQPQPAGTLLVDLDDAVRRPSGDVSRELLWELLDGAGTRPCAAIFDDRAFDVGAYHDARHAAAAWLLGEPPRTTAWSRGGTDTAQKAWEHLRSLPAGEALARVEALRRVELRCERADLIAVLTGPDEPR